MGTSRLLKSMLIAGLVIAMPGVVATDSAYSVTTSAPPSHAQSPGGELVFTRAICDSDTDPCWEVVVSNANDSKELVVAGPYARSVWDDHFVANWAPDGRTVIFMADLGQGQEIWRVRSDGTHLRAVFVPPAGTFLDDGPAFTPDGRHIVFTRCCAPEVVTGYALWSITADGHNLHQVTSEAVPPGVDGPSDNLPQVSPNGRWVAFHQGTPESIERIAVASMTSGPGPFETLTSGVLDGQIPNWSPNSRYLVFQAADGNIWRIDRTGRHLTQLTFDGASVNPSYSPDGSKIVFSHIAEDGTRDLYVMNADGSNARLLRHADGDERFPHWINPRRAP